MLLNAIIVDDEEHSRKSLYFLIDTYCSKKVKIKGIACSVPEGRSFLEKGEINLVFLDIAMPKEDGFRLLPDLEKSNASVIFTTAYDQYALRAIKASAVDYLLKPIDLDELQVAIQKAVDFKTLSESGRETNPNAQMLNTLNDNLNEIKKIKKLNLPHSNGFHVINLDDLVYVEADSNYSVFHVKNGEKILVSKHLKEYENLLNSSGFSRIHKSTIINLSHLIDYSNKNGLKVRLSNNYELPVSRRRGPAFLNLVKNTFQK